MHKPPLDKAGKKMAGRPTIHRGYACRFSPHPGEGPATNVAALPCKRRGCKGRRGATNATPGQPCNTSSNRRRRCENYSPEAQSPARGLDPSAKKRPGVCRLHHPFQGIEISFARSNVFAGQNHVPMTFGSFWNSFTSFGAVPADVKLSRNDPGARFGSFDFSWQV